MNGKFQPARWALRFMGAAAAVVLLALLGTGCAVTPKAQPAPPPPPVVFPPPPEAPRILFLGSISSPKDLPRKHGGFAEFVLGPEDDPAPALAKPNLALLRGDQLYVADTVFNAIFVYNLQTGDVHRLAGDQGIGKIQQPNAMTFDEEGRLYIADKVRRAVIVYNPDESFLAAWGRPEEAKPTGIALIGDEMFVCDTDEHEIEVWNRQDGSFLRKFGGIGKEPGKFFFPTSMAVDGEGHLFITDTGNFRVQKLTPSGECLQVFGSAGNALGHFAWPKGLDVDSHGRLYVADSRFANVQIFDPQGRLLLFFGAPGPTGGNLDLPAGVRVSPWPRSEWLQKRLLPGFDPEFLAIVVSQQGAGLVNFFAVARDPGTSQ